MRDPLERTLSFNDLTLITIGVVIGSGIFIVPATVLRQVGGDVGTALLVWLAAGVLSLLGALTYGELGAMRPQAGGLYVFMRDAFGPFIAFLFGWTLFFVIATGAVATLSAAFTGYLEQFVTLGPAGRKLAAVGMIIVVSAINIVGTRTSAGVQVWTTAAKVLVLVVMSLILLTHGAGLSMHGASLVPRGLGVGVLPGIGLAMVGVLWAYEGWQYVTFSAGETLDPQRTFPRALTVGTIVLIVLYCLANIAYVSVLGPERAQASESIAAAAMASLFGPAAGRLVAAGILLSIFSAANAVVLTASRVTFAMARDGVFFRQLGRVHERFGTPAFAIGAAAVWSSLLAATGTFEQLLTYVVFTGWIFYALGAAAVFVFRRREPDIERPFRVPGYPFTPLLFVVASAAIVLNTLFSQPVQALLGLGVVFLGAPAYGMWQRAGRRETGGGRQEAGD